MRTHPGELLQRRQHVEIGRIAVRILTGGQRPRLLALRAAGHERDQFEQRIGRGRQRHPEQYLAQRLAVDLGHMRCAEHGDDLVHQAEIVGGEYAKGVADNIVETRLREIEFDVPGFLFRTRLVDLTARQERRHRRIVRDRPGAPTGPQRQAQGWSNRSGCCRRGSRRLLKLFIRDLSIRAVSPPERRD
jgi:hypothetical protein